MHGYNRVSRDAASAGCSGGNEGTAADACLFARVARRSGGGFRTMAQLGRLVAGRCLASGRVGFGHYISGDAKSKQPKERGMSGARTLSDLLRRAETGMVFARSV